MLEAATMLASARLNAGIPLKPTVIDRSFIFVTAYVGHYASTNN